MSEKLLAGLVTAAVVAPICALCILGPAALGAFVAGSAGWLGGLDPTAAGGLAIVVAVVVYGLIRRRKAKAVCGPPDHRPSRKANEDVIG